jgi:hypothetical protein
VAGSCEHGNEPLISIRRVGISWLAEQQLASQKRPWSSLTPVPSGTVPCS